MSKPRREYHPKRTAKAVRDHESTMSALGRAAGWERYQNAFMKRPYAAPTEGAWSPKYASSPAHMFEVGGGHVDRQPLVKDKE